MGYISYTSCAPTYHSSAENSPRSGYDSPTPKKKALNGAERDKTPSPTKRANRGLKKFRKSPKILEEEFSTDSEDGTRTKAKGEEDKPLFFFENYHKVTFSLSCNKKLTAVL